MGLIKKVIDKEMFYGAKPELFDLALSLRKNPTDAEEAMWKIIRKFRRSGYPFRRQHPIEFYIADFYCHNLRLVIEVDGEIHSEEEVSIHDESRTGELERLGINVIRFSNNQVLNESDFVTTEIESIINILKQPPPLTPGEGDRGGEVD